MVIHGCNPSPQEMEAGGRPERGKRQEDHKLKASLGYITALTKQPTKTQNEGKNESIK